MFGEEHYGYEEWTPKPTTPKPTTNPTLVERKGILMKAVRETLMETVAESLTNRGYKMSKLHFPTPTTTTASTTTTQATTPKPNHDKQLKILSEKMSNDG